MLKLPDDQWNRIRHHFFRRRTRPKGQRGPSAGAGRSGVIGGDEAFIDASFARARGGGAGVGSRRSERA